jgi:hypothetical protein
MKTRNAQSIPTGWRTARAGRCFAFAGLLLAGTAPSGLAQDLGSLTRITGSSPFAGCTADQAGSQPGTLYPQTEIEPRADANPANRRNLIVGWQQDRWSNGGARGLPAGLSFDGGATWRTVRVPGTSACTGGVYKRASDPWVSIAPNGTAYYMSLAFDPDLPSGAFGRNAMLVNRSTDGGRTWSRPITLIRDPAGQALNDKNSLTADPTDARFAYAVWDRLQDFTLPPGDIGGGGPAGARERAKRLREADAAGTLAATPPIFKGPALLARTANGGRTWGEARVIYDPGNNAQTINNIVVVPPSGVVIDFFTEINGNGGTRIGLVRSFDKGRTFSRPSYATVIATVFGVVTPDTLELVRDASILFDVTADPRNGNLYLVWQDTRFNGIDRIAFAQSGDSGRTWSTPVPINRTPVNRANRLRQQAFVPTVKVGADGRLVVTYYDFRNDHDRAQVELTDHWAVLCDPGEADCRRSSNWAVERRLTARSFDMLQAPEANGFFLGDYMGAASTGRRVLPVFGVADGENRTSLFTRPINFGAAGVGDLAAAP